MTAMCCADQSPDVKDVVAIVHVPLPSFSHAHKSCWRWNVFVLKEAVALSSLSFIFLTVSLCLCLSVCLSVCLCLRLSVSVCLSVSVSHSLRLPLSLSFSCSLASFFFPYFSPLLTSPSSLSRQYNMDVLLSVNLPTLSPFVCLHVCTALALLHRTSSNGPEK